MLIDGGKELSAAELAGDEGFVRRNRRLRLSSLVAGLLLVPVDGALLLAHVPAFILGGALALTGSLLLTALVLTPRAAARRELARPVDLDRFSSRE